MRELETFEGHLKGAYLNDIECQRILKLHQLNDAGKGIPEMKGLIRNLSDTEIDTVLKTRQHIEGSVGELSDIQTIGVAFLATAKRALLGDSVGMGKTPQSAGLIQWLKLKEGKCRYIYFTEKTLMKKDQKELIRFTGDYTHLLKGETAFLKKELAELTEEELPYSFVASHSVIKSTVFQEWLLVYMDKYGHMPFDLVIIDEASAVATTSEKTDYYKSAKTICQDCDRVVLLNATPFESRLDSFRLQLTLVDSTFLPKKTEFQKKFQKTRFNGEYVEYIDEYKNEEAFREAIKLRFMARRRKDTGGTMANCEAKLVIVEKSPTQKRMEKLTSIPQMVYDCPSALDRSVKMTVHTTPKLQKILDIVKKNDTEKSILIYCRYKESQDGILKVLREHGYSCEKLNGDTPEKTRNKVIQDFQNGLYKILVTNVQKGLNFGNCNVTIFYSALPNPNQMVQVEGRMTRSYDIFGKKVYLLATRGRELRNLQDVIAGRAKASENFAGSDFSLILDLLRKQQKGAS